MYMVAPPEPFVPEEWQGRLVAAIAGMWIGPPDDGASVLRPLVNAARPVVDLFGELPYTELQSMIDDPPGMRNWWTADYLDECPTGRWTRSAPTPSACPAARRSCW